MVLIKICQENILYGILGIICGLFALIYGWVRVTEYRIQKVMLWWTVAIVGVILIAVAGVSGAGLPAG